jgi:hypothetical protein
VRKGDFNRTEQETLHQIRVLFDKKARFRLELAGCLCNAAVPDRLFLGSKALPLLSSAEDLCVILYVVAWSDRRRKDAFGQPLFLAKSFAEAMQDFRSMNFRIAHAGLKYEGRAGFPALPLFAAIVPRYQGQLSELQGSG